MSGVPVAELKRWLPPVAFDALKSRFGTRFAGDYPSWAAALRDSSGYDAPAIAERVAEATRRVIRGEAAYERDSLLFPELERAWPLVACLLRVALASGNRLRVLDFGGSLGSTYRQNASFLAGLRELRWTVVEQPTFVELGQREFTTTELHFESDLGRALAEPAPDVVLFSCVLQYVEQPFAVLERVMASRVPFILFDRTPFIPAAADRLTVQTVSRRVYPASYPAWFFARDKFLAQFAGRYRLLEQFRAIDRVNVPSDYSGMLLAREP